MYKHAWGSYGKITPEVYGKCTVIHLYHHNSGKIKDNKNRYATRRQAEKEFNKLKSVYEKKGDGDRLLLISCVVDGKSEILDKWGDKSLGKKFYEQDKIARAEKSKKKKKPPKGKLIKDMSEEEREEEQVKWENRHRLMAERFKRETLEKQRKSIERSQKRKANPKKNPQPSWAKNMPDRIRGFDVFGLGAFYSMMSNLQKRTLEWAYSDTMALGGEGDVLIPKTRVANLLGYRFNLVQCVDDTKPRKYRLTKAGMAMGEYLVLRRKSEEWGSPSPWANPSKKKVAKKRAAKRRLNPPLEDRLLSRVDIRSAVKSGDFYTSTSYRFDNNSFSDLPVDFVEAVRGAIPGWKGSWEYRKPTILEDLFQSKRVAVVFHISKDDTWKNHLAKVMPHVRPDHGYRKPHYGDNSVRILESLFDGGRESNPTRNSGSTLARPKKKVGGFTAAQKKKLRLGWSQGHPDFMISEIVLSEPIRAIAIYRKGSKWGSGVVDRNGKLIRMVEVFKRGSAFSAAKAAEDIVLEKALKKKVAKNKPAKKKVAKKPARKKTPEWQLLCNRCAKLWDHYCERPSKTRLKPVLEHLEKMKSSTSKKVADERKACLRVANKEARRLKMK